MNSYHTRLLFCLAGSAGIHLLVLEVWFVMATLGTIFPQPDRKQEETIAKLEVPVLTIVEPPKPKRFVETDSRVETREAPKDSELYSDRSSKAANPNPGPEAKGDKPKLEGKDSRILSTEDVPLPVPLELVQPLAPPGPPQPEKDLQKELAPKPEPKPKPKPKPDKTELAMRGKEPERKESADKPKPTAKPAEQKQARLAPPATERVIPEAESKTRSSVSNEGLKAFDVTGTKFGDYDRRLIAAVKTRWMALIEQYTIPGERSGQVALRFHLYDDGTVQELTVAENTAGDILALYCQKAVTDSAPFGEWPEELKTLVKRRYRELNFIFYY